MFHGGEKRSGCGANSLSFRVQMHVYSTNTSAGLQTHTYAHEQMITNAQNKNTYTHMHTSKSNPILRTCEFTSDALRKVCHKALYTALTEPKSRAVVLIEQYKGNLKTDSITDVIVLH